MNRRLKAIPKFANEAAERAFWEKRDSTAYVDWQKAQTAVFPNLKPSTQTISLRLPQHLLDSIMTAANARDVPYQSLIKVWLQEKLQDSSFRLPKPSHIRRTLGRRRRFGGGRIGLRRIDGRGTGIRFLMRLAVIWQPCVDFRRCLRIGEEFLASLDHLVEIAAVQPPNGETREREREGEYVDEERARRDELDGVGAGGGSNRGSESP